MSKPVGPYTPIVRAGDFLFVSGQLGLVDGALADGVAAQTTQALKNLEAVAASEGVTLEQVVKTTVFLTNMDDFATMNEAYVAGFGDHRPARSAVAVRQLPLGGVVEIEAVIYSPGLVDYR